MAKAEDTPLVEKLDGDDSGLGLGARVATYASVISLVSIVVIKVQLTAWLFHTSHFPTAYSLFSALVTDAMLVPIFLIWPQTWGYPALEMFGPPKFTFTLIILFTTFDMAFTNIALANISVAQQQCIAATGPFWTIIIEGVVLNKLAKTHALVYATVTGLVAGAVLVSVAGASKMNAIGIVFACAAVLCSASKYVFTHAAFKQYKNRLGALSLLFWVDLCMIPILLPWAGIAGELASVFEANMSAGEWLKFTGTAALGGVRALTQFFVLSYTTATSMSVANTFALTLNILISMTWQPTHLTPMLVSGIVLVIGCAALYAYLKTAKNACGGILRKSDPPS